MTPIKLRDKLARFVGAGMIPWMDEAFNETSLFVKTMRDSFQMDAEVERNRKEAAQRARESKRALILAMREQKKKLD